jgi:hypothetical protein
MADAGAPAQQQSSCFERRAGGWCACLCKQAGGTSVLSCCDGRTYKATPSMPPCLLQLLSIEHTAGYSSIPYKEFLAVLGERASILGSVILNHMQDCLRGRDLH